MLLRRPQRRPHVRHRCNSEGRGRFVFLQLCCILVCQRPGYCGQAPQPSNSPQTISRWLSALDLNMQCTAPAQDEAGLQVQEWLGSVGVASAWPGFAELGVTSMSDLQYVEENDLKSMGLRPVQRRKLLAALNEQVLTADGAMSDTSVIASFPTIVPPHMHPKFAETQEAVAQQVLNMPLSRLREMFSQEAQQQSQLRGEAASFVESLDEAIATMGSAGLGGAWDLTLSQLLDLQRNAMQSHVMGSRDEDSTISQAIASFRAGDLLHAKELFDNADVFLPAAPDFTDDVSDHVLFGRGVELMRDRRFEAAVAAFSAILAVEPTHRAARHNLDVSRARLSSSKYRLAHSIEEVSSLLDAAFAQSPSEGMILEFGVYQGNTLRRIAELAATRRRREDATVHGFDSWEGLPTPFAGIMPSGSWSTRHALPKNLPTNTQLHHGWFNESVPQFVAAHASESVAFAHVDSDLYESAIDALAPLACHLVGGSVIVFDEYFDYPGWQSGEFAAWQRIVRDFGVQYEYIGAYRMRAAVQIVQPPQSCEKQ